MSLYDEIMKEAEAELAGSQIEKKANDENGSPDQPQTQGQQDINQVAQEFLSKIEAFKEKLNGVLAGVSPNAQTPPQEGDEAVNKTANPEANATAPVENAGGTTIQTPGGTVIKLASLIKLAALRPGLFREAK